MTPSAHTTLTAATARKTPAPDAIALLKADHALVHGLFDEYSQARSPSRKQALILQLCAELSVHMQLEEELLYPAVVKLKTKTLLVPEASVEHAGIKDLIAQLENTDADTPLVDAQVKVLSEYVRHHVAEEHTSMFPLIEASSIDTRALGQRMAARKRALLSLTA